MQNGFKNYCRALMSPKNKQKLREFLFRAHKTIGIVFGLAFVLVGLSGSVLAFREDIDELLNYSLMRVAPTYNESFRPIDEIFAAASSQIPENAKLERFTMPRHPHAAASLSYMVETDDLDSYFYEIFINPYTATVTGQRLKIHGEDQFSQPFIQILMAFHWTLLLGVNNAYLIGCVGIFFFFSIFIGLYLWRPANNNWRAALTFKWRASSERITYDIHRNIGFYGAIFLVIMTSTGVAMIFKPATRALTSLFTVVHNDPDFGKSKPLKEGKPIGLGEVVKIADSVFSTGRIISISLPSSPTGVYVVGKISDSEPNKTRAYKNVGIDQYSGDILHVQDPAAFSVGDKIFEWLFPLHTGEFFGEFGRPILFLIGLIPFLLFTTGLLRWRQKFSVRKRMKIS